MLPGGAAGPGSTRPAFEMSSRCCSKYSGLPSTGTTLIRKHNIITLTSNTFKYSVMAACYPPDGWSLHLSSCHTSTLRRSTVHQGDFSDLVSVHFLPSCTMVGIPSTALEAHPSPDTLLAVAGLYLQLENETNDKSR